jgi:hypothetical protein
MSEINDHMSVGGCPSRAVCIGIYNGLMAFVVLTVGD